MPISHEQFVLWIDRIASLEGLMMDPEKLVEDLVLIADAFHQDPETFSVVMENTFRAFQLILRVRNVGTALSGNKAGWISYHFQSHRVRRHKADMRIVYRDTGTAIQIMGFGHRWIPQSIYDRLSPPRP
ncbi:MAG: hypothetical protein C7B44_15330 [Sulfobacillus thermosulfidooxidans]|uniref:Uncharacterized protein n=1 Tax=Sulfobacillus acidophilus TaxID=53633 RepID=A0A2T2WCH2_9FIRM|nr:MAG: hypothetical protein C7B45_17510 [Sulfobacillus acidophilus]PSR32481.1 MAG: hypothetical protein C7B44_15330 [Sulfobacillus thermosulfidooxidans]